MWRLTQLTIITSTRVEFDRYSVLTNTIFAHTHLPTKLSILQLSKYPQYTYLWTCHTKEIRLNLKYCQKSGCVVILYIVENHKQIFMQSTLQMYCAHINFWNYDCVLYSHKLPKLWLCFVSRSKWQSCVLSPIYRDF